MQYRKWMDQESKVLPVGEDLDRKPSNEIVSSRLLRGCKVRGSYQGGWLSLFKRVCRSGIEQGLRGLVMGQRESVLIVTL